VSGVCCFGCAAEDDRDAADVDAFDAAVMFDAEHESGQREVREDPGRG
jgi:hypothetical protein